MGEQSAADRSEAFANAFDAVCRNVHQVVQGADDVVKLMVTALLSGGHVLIEDVPGVGKTTLAKALAATVGGQFGRVQFTPDLMPSDVVGTSVWNQSTGAFTFRKGPIFANVLLADEINRASPKTQSALLESMAEEQVTVDGQTFELPAPFVVVATQNPLEHKGTFALPESQLDRFLMRLSVGYPTRSDELTLASGINRASMIDRLQPVMSLDAVRSMISYAERVHVAPEIAGYAVDIARWTRVDDRVALGMSPRAVIGLIAAARVWAAAQQRPYVSADDVQHLLLPVVAHRLVLSISGGHAQVRSVLDDAVGSVPPPRPPTR